MTLPDYSPGTLVADRYRVVRPLGQGGMGAVLEVEHVQLEVRRALKVLLPEAAKDAEGAERFLRGARNAARIQHPNVCQVYDFGVMDDGRQYLAMEFISGRSLGQAMKAGEVFAVQQALVVVRSIALALEAAHELGVVHRDLKPDNIMLGPGWESGVGVKVVDFDIARRMGEGEVQDLTLTRPNFAVGTPEYMSPEQAAGQRLDGRSDLYSLGLILYRMISGVLPFQGSNSQEVMVSRLIRDPIPIQQAVPHVMVPAGVVSLFSHLLARHPADRTPSARDVLEELDQLIRTPGAETVTAPGGDGAEADGEAGQEPEGSTRDGRRASRSLSPWGAGAGAVLAVAVVIALWVVAPGSVDEGSGSDLSASAPEVAVGLEPVRGDPDLPPPGVAPDESWESEGGDGGDSSVEEPPPRAEDERAARETWDESDTVLRPITDSGVDQLLPTGQGRDAGANPVELPEALDDLLVSLASALTARDESAVRSLYPAVTESELDVWWGLLGADAGPGQASLDFHPQTPLEVDGEVAQVRALMARVRREGEEEATPWPFRLVLDVGSDGSLQVRELLRLWN
ncbi:MAG: serine/threonine protein kinase [Gemmatimonadales bacterium]|nr:MAG: serine/threonine protein kinase [Gemmatimonadales bacterium]